MLEMHVLKGADAQTRQSLRAEHSAALLADLKACLDDQEFLPKSIIGQASDVHP